ncbi:uncharacterized protein N7477_000774 [Penicillium maclennaniae]|uniref:uncharacterized protein n=1 Tax=Penicillium maclennaniae TaxID=1343394 RepID=UPI0025413F26|nr:uncharacterized protein N7477_000774 [Penicillium maclennaniae]KAJ5684429.1 hypothetical protein N7477_000774 [Penicillium maclennaniae]
MSADLWAEFGQGSGSAQSSDQPRIPQPQTSSFISGFDQADDLILGGPQLSKSQFSNTSAPPPQYAPSSHRQPPTFQAFDLPKQHDSDILFDATQDTPASEEEDEWGEFEGPEESAEHGQPSISAAIAQDAKAPAPRPQLQAPSNSKVPTTIDLLDSLSLDDPAPIARQLPKPGPKTIPQANTPPPDEPSWDEDSFGDWGDFTDGPPTTLATTNRNSPSTTSLGRHFRGLGRLHRRPKYSTSISTPKANLKTSLTAINDKPTTPKFHLLNTKIPPQMSDQPTSPPPSVLLELLVDLFNNLQEEAATAKRQSDQAAAAKLHNTLETASRIIAGRTLRWKRDTILSQSMRIGPAGKPGGMKLSAVNKHENVKEEQDAVDVLSLWRERAALFNAVIQTAGLRPIPPISGPSALKVTTAKLEQGGIKAGHACALCALRRDERILKIDEDVQDSFGEWWTEHWGHTGCRMFWERNSRLLGQR